MENIPEISDLEIALRILLAIGLCSLIGLERERLGQVAGMRTHLLVGAGAALFTLISAYAFSGWIVDNPNGASPTPVDPSRVAAQIVAGIGFLGAGAIITQGVTVRGLTTAATLWISAAIGMAAGIGFYFAAIAVTLMVILALIGIRRFRQGVVSQLRSNIIVIEIRAKKDKHLGKFIASLGNENISLQRMDPLKKNRHRLELLVPADADMNTFRELIINQKGVNLRSLTGARPDAVKDID